MRGGGRPSLKAACARGLVHRASTSRVTVVVDDAEEVSVRQTGASATLQPTLERVSEPFEVALADERAAEAHEGDVQA
jgi:hypothetical protein